MMSTPSYAFLVFKSDRKYLYCKYPVTESHILSAFAIYEVQLPDIPITYLKKNKNIKLSLHSLVLINHAF